MGADENTESQVGTDEAASLTESEDLGDNGKKALSREREARRAAEAKLKELQPLAERARELEESQKSEQQRLMERAEAAEAERKRLESAVTRLRIAAKNGIPEELAELLGDGDEETLQARAKALMEWRGAPGSPVPSAPVEATRSTVLAGDDTPADPNDWLRARIRAVGQ